jgi:putative hemolysin
MPAVRKAGMAQTQHAETEIKSTPKWPVLVEAGPLQVRIATTQAELEAAQRLRYRVFYEEMTAVPSPQMRATGRDFDKFDAFADQLLVVDTSVRAPDGSPIIVGTYRLMRDDVAEKAGGFYTSGEYDLEPMFNAHGPGTRYLELGRSCVLKEYRLKPISLQLLWRGIVLYLHRYGLNVFFGCASFPGVDPGALKLGLSYLHHFHRAPEGARPRALPELYVEMNLMPKEAINEREAIKSLPPLIKGYVRAGSYIGDGAVIDRQFDTIDVLMYFPFVNMDPRWKIHFGRAAG